MEKAHKPSDYHKLAAMKAFHQRVQETVKGHGTAAWMMGNFDCGPFVQSTCYQSARIKTNKLRGP
jgi:hypothetical protein